MLDLSPTKLLIIFVVVVVLLGPKRLPEVARQLGAGWRKLRELHGRFDSELRQTMPDLPTSQEIVRFARSPLTLLDRLADGTDAGSPAQDGLGTRASDGAGPDGAGPVDGGAPVDGAGSNGAGSNGRGPADGIVPAGSRAPDGGPRAGAPRGASARAAEVGPPAVSVSSLVGLDADDPNLN